jgi:alpha-beta hydrolase superfamily lysophospholipase
MTFVKLSLRLRTGSSAALLLKSDAPRATLVVAHGAGNDHLYSFAPFFGAAMARGFQILSLDLPGHGRGNTSVFEVEAAVADFAEAVEQALAPMTRLGLPWFLLGNSLGGSLALRATAARLLRPHGVVTIGMPTQFHRDLRTPLGEIPSLASRAMRSYRTHVASWKEVFPAFGPFRRAEFPVRCDRPDYLDAVAAVLNRPWEALPGEIPVLMVQGTRDAVARLAETRRWVAAARAQGAELALQAVPGVGHLDVMLDPRIQRAVLDWTWGQSAGFP